MTYTCTVPWCLFDGRNMTALRRHLRAAHAWLVAREVRANVTPEDARRELAAWAQDHPRSQYRKARP
jgi:hypothetical protein